MNGSCAFYVEFRETGIVCPHYSCPSILNKSPRVYGEVLAVVQINTGYSHSLINFSRKFTLMVARHFSQAATNCWPANCLCLWGWNKRKFAAVSRQEALTQATIHNQHVLPVRNTRSTGLKSGKLKMCKCSILSSQFQAIWKLTLALKSLPNH